MKERADEKILKNSIARGELLFYNPNYTYSKTTQCSGGLSFVKVSDEDSYFLQKLVQRAEKTRMETVEKIKKLFKHDTRSDMDRKEPRRLPQVNKAQILAGAFSLTVGLFVYLLDRPAEGAYFLHRTSTAFSLHDALPGLLFGALGGNLPTFIHVFSFSLLTAGLLACKKRGCQIVILSWLLANCAFELGQKFVRISPNVFRGVPILENIGNFFVNGTFDPLDLVAATAGATAAYLFLLATMKRRYRL